VINAPIGDVRAMSAYPSTPGISLRCGERQKRDMNGLMQCNKFRKVGRRKISTAKLAGSIRPSNFTAPTIPNLEAEVTQSTAVVLDGKRFR